MALRPASDLARVARAVPSTMIQHVDRPSHNASSRRDLLAHRAVVAAFEQGRVTGIPSIVGGVEHRVTQVSHLFFTGPRVYKICRADNEAFNRAMYDLSDPAVRSAFMCDDFALNRYFSRDVHLALLVAAPRDGSVALVPPESEGERVIVMRRVDERTSLTSQLLAGGPDGATAHRAGRWLATRSARYPVDPEQRRRSFTALMSSRLDDVAAFSALGAPRLAAEEAGRIVGWLAERMGDLTGYLDAPPEGLVVGLDCHADNVFARGDRCFVLDAFQIKPNWRLVDPLLNVCRLGADLRVLGSAELLGALLGGYRERYPSHALPPSVIRFYVVYAALIRIVLWIEAGRGDLADLYLDFVRSAIV